jgi:ubiquinol-cytochrome c reductase cytochrome b subunit
VKLGDWLEERAGWRGWVRGALHEPVLGGASFFYVFGSVLLFLLILQFTTGILLAFYYAPSATDAWASVANIEDGITMGWLVRGLHHHGASAIVIVAGMHLMQTALWGAYKRPREVNWWTGVMLLGLLLAFALTGYLLPWDQTGYWATKVATGIAGETPLLGKQVQEAVQGGNEYGNLTLTRFYALHVFVLPALTIGLVALHLVLFRRHGVTPSWRKSKEQLRAQVQPFWPDQMFKDMVAMAIAFAALLGWTWHEHGARLDAPADPSSNFDARPEWYFRPLFQMLKYFEGSLQTVAALGVPAVVGAVLLGLPFLDRADTRCPKRRVLPLGLLGAGIVLTGVLTVISFSDDAADEQLGERQEQAERDAARARKLAVEHGVPSAGGTAVYTTAPFHRARAIWAHECASCHEGESRKAPVIGAGYNSRAWIGAFLREPSGEAFYGRTKLGQSDSAMDKVEGTDAELKALVEAIYAETGAPDVNAKLAEEGRALFDGDAGCTDCHSRKAPIDPIAACKAAEAPAVDAGVAAPSGEAEAEAEAEDGEEEEASGGTAPNLAGRGSPAYLTALIRDPMRFYGCHNEMDAFLDVLGPDDLRLMVEWLTWLRTATDADIEALGPP